MTSSRRLRALIAATIAAVMCLLGAASSSATPSVASPSAPVSQDSARDPDPPGNGYRWFAKRYRQGQVKHFKGSVLERMFKGRPKRIRRALVQRVATVFRLDGPGGRYNDTWDSNEYVTTWLRRTKCIVEFRYIPYAYEHDVCMGEDDYTVSDIKDSMLVAACAAGAGFGFAGGFVAGILASAPCANAAWDRWSD